MEKVCANCKEPKELIYAHYRKDGSKIFLCQECFAKETTLDCNKHKGSARVHK